MRDLEPYSAATLHECDPTSRVLPVSLRPIGATRSLRGNAFPVLQARGDNAWIHRALHRAPAGSILVVATGDDGFGYWGELMTRTALRRGLAGLVIEGGVRDVEAIRTLRFPVFASAICMRGTTKRSDSPGSLGRPVQLGDARIDTGTVIVGDHDGIVALGEPDLAGLAERAAVRVADERRMVRDLEAGRRPCEVLWPAGLAADGPESFLP